MLMASEQSPMNRFGMPRISTRQEALLWFVCAAIGCQLTQSLLPSRRIALAQQIEPEQAREQAREVVVRPHTGKVSEVDGQRKLPVSPCRVPPGGGPALNASFEPC